MKFDKKINYNEVKPTKIIETVRLQNGIYDGILKHDNVIEDSIVVKDEMGYVIESVSIEPLKDKHWSLSIIIQSHAEFATIEYLTLGDTVDADDINLLQDAIVELKNEIDNTKVPEIDLSGIESQIERLNTIKADKKDVNREIAEIYKRITEIQGIIKVHTENKNNPHNVTKATIGLDKVDNTADLDKPISKDAQDKFNDIMDILRDKVSLDDIPQHFHDAPQNEIKESMTPRDFEYGATICSQNLANDFPSINEYGVTLTLVGRHSNYSQIFITRFGDIWARRSTALNDWNGEWYNAKNEIDKKANKDEVVSSVNGQTQQVLLTGDNIPLSNTVHIPIGNVLDEIYSKIENMNTVPKGMISMWSGSLDNIPSGWALCNGENGTPNLLERFIVGAGDRYAVNQKGGEEKVSLKDFQLPAHTHSSGSLHTSSETHRHNMIWLRKYDDGLDTGFARNSRGNYEIMENSYMGGGAHIHSIKGETGSVGMGAGHENRPPFYALAFIIKL